MAMKMITELCGDDAQKWTEIKEVSVIALDKELVFGMLLKKLLQ
jgi:hypothetical protein